MFSPARFTCKVFHPRSFRFTIFFFFYQTRGKFWRKNHTKSLWKKVCWRSLCVHWLMGPLDRWVSTGSNGVKSGLWATLQGEQLHFISSTERMCLCYETISMGATLANQQSENWTSGCYATTPSLPREEDLLCYWQQIILSDIIYIIYKTFINYTGDCTFYLT